MRIGDALKAVVRKSERGPLLPLRTVWSERAQDGTQIPLCEYPRPQMRRGGWECLNGWWEYAFCGRKEKPDSAQGRILVPFSPETSRSTVGRVLKPDEALWYRRTVTIAEIRKDSRLLLHFGAVDERCTVWWNRRRLGNHRGGYLPFSFDVTEAALAGENEILVRVLDDTDTGEACRGKQKLHPGGMFYTPQSGIWQTVWTEWVPDLYIRRLRWLPHPEKEEVELRILTNRFLSEADVPAASKPERREDLSVEQPAEA
ncbi:MAG: hypothetical protein Q4D81_08230, partial [Eubacteriales bacterium]|nr:hypothetical protein [Eubacteriales bacterium]